MSRVSRGGGLASRALGDFVAPSSQPERAHKNPLQFANTFERTHTETLEHSNTSERVLGSLSRSRLAFVRSPVAITLLLFCYHYHYYGRHQFAS